MNAALDLNAPPPKHAWDDIIAASMRARYDRNCASFALPLLSAQQMAERGEEIYDRLYRAECEREHFGRFVAVDLYSERAFVADTSTEAIIKGAQACPGASFHVIRVGFDAAIHLHTHRDHDC